jgi:excisionase family DNA binding protein
MQAYATAERVAQPAGIHPNAAADPMDLAAPIHLKHGASFDVLLNQLVDLVAERVVDRMATPATPADGWLDTRSAAEYLGVHPDTVRRLAAERTVPSEQEGPGCKLFFRRRDLDAWRCGARNALRVLSGGRS